MGNQIKSRDNVGVGLGKTKCWYAFLLETCWVSESKDVSLLEHSLCLNIEINLDNNAKREAGNEKWQHNEPSQSLRPNLKPIPPYANNDVCIGSWWPVMPSCCEQWFCPDVNMKSVLMRTLSFTLLRHNPCLMKSWNFRHWERNEGDILADTTIKKQSQRRRLRRHIKDKGCFQQYMAWETHFVWYDKTCISTNRGPHAWAGRFQNQIW